ncbi:hypothetical protein SEUCBS139899_004214 [Sporothrix eucalyptigena]|uniref:Uncharacterized protein n=1 Tax=Sporothrix eucalyptigena TaxID=1812306 RepID=A0ABP0B0D3_9PEZI
MVNRVGKWARGLRQRFQSYDGSNGNAEATKPLELLERPPPELPYLNGSAGASRTSLTDKLADNASSSGMARSFLFTCLPAEIRRQILMEAFGGRTVHMDLRIGSLMKPMAERAPITFSPNKLPHGGLGAELGSIPLFSEEALLAAVDARILDSEERKKHPLWQWWSCVCHRTMPDPGHVAPLTEDECCKGRSMYCFMYPGTKPGKCLLGCMGWLLTCRQAYAEGIDVLYGTNTIFIGRKKLLDALLPTERPTENDTPRHILPMAHLARLRKLAVVWNWSLGLGVGEYRLNEVRRQQHHENERGRMGRQLARLADPAMFPRLQHITFGFGDTLYQWPAEPDGRIDEIEDVLLRPFGEMVAAFRASGRKVNTVVELPKNVFEPLYANSERTGGIIGEPLSYSIQRFWWAFEKEEDEVETKGEGVGGVGGVGFWVQTGIKSHIRHNPNGNPYILGVASAS